LFRESNRALDQLSLIRRKTVYRNRRLAEILLAFLGYNIFAENLAFGFARADADFKRRGRRPEVRHGEKAQAW
jgi:hypothetical protein